jgi:hypothetical protein
MGINNRLLAAAVTLAFVCVVAAKVEFVSRRNPVKKAHTDTQPDFEIFKGHAHGHHHAEGSSMKKAFAYLFPFESPAWNSSMSISSFVNEANVKSWRHSTSPRELAHSHFETSAHDSIPNFILLAVPATLDPSSLNTMIAFATGGLLGDVFLHLVPHSFFGEGAEGHHRAVVVEEKRNIVIGSVTPNHYKHGLII